MSRRGRKAALPPSEPPRRPPARVAGTLIVEHRDKKGGVARYDFAECQGPEAMRESLAKLFAGCCTRGVWDSLETSDGAFRIVKMFAKYMAKHHPGVEDVDGMTAGVWKEWKLSCPKTATGYNRVTLVARLLRQDVRLTLTAREAIDERVAPVQATEQSYSPDEFTQITTVARRIFRAAHLRITSNAVHLAAWRAGAYAEGSDDWLVGDALDCLARTGDVPRYEGKGGRRRVINRYKRALGGQGAEVTWQRLLLTLSEATALATLLMAEHGLNLSTVSDLAAPRATPDPGEDGFPIYRVELEKERRGSGRHFETRNFTDFGASSPGRLITQALEATAFARVLVHEQEPELDRLLIWRDSSGRAGSYDEEKVLRVGQFGVGTTSNYASQWARLVGLSGSPFRRGRRTVNVLIRREPGQNTQDTYDSVYVLRDKQAQQGAIGDIAEGMTAALETARETVLVASLREAPDPDDEPTATADCNDIKHSPFTAHGISCGASFLLCLACPNARVHPGHHSRLALLHRALGSLRSVMDPAEWRSDWYDPHARLDHLKKLLSQPVWDKALVDATEADQDLIDHLLKGDFDQ